MKFDFIEISFDLLEVGGRGGSILEYRCFLQYIFKAQCNLIHSDIFAMGSRADVIK